MHALDSLKKEGVPVIAGTAVIAISHNSTPCTTSNWGDNFDLFDKGGKA